MRTEKSKEAGTEDMEGVEQAAKKQGTVDTFFTDSRAVETETGPEVEMLRPAVKRHYFI